MDRKWDDWLITFISIGPWEEGIVIGEATVMRRWLSCKSSRTRRPSARKKRESRRRSGRGQDARDGEVREEKRRCLRHNQILITENRADAWSGRNRKYGEEDRTSLRHMFFFFYDNTVTCQCPIFFFLPSQCPNFLRKSSIETKLVNIKQIKNNFGCFVRPILCFMGL